jgi:hypothetical protein
MGHANRPRLHHALGLDAQSRRLCLSSARRCESNTNTNGFAECYSNRNSDGNSNGYADSNGNTETYAHTEGCADTEAASYAAATAIRLLTSK